MADTKISALTELAAGAVAGDDLVAVVDTSATATKKVQVKNLSHYKKYVALLTQSGTDAPVATVLENSLGGTVVWTRAIAGGYTATLAGAFADLKTWIVSALAPKWNGTEVTIGAIRNDANTVNLYVYNVAGNGTDNFEGAIEIRVYP